MEEDGVYPHCADESSEARQSNGVSARDHGPFSGSCNSKPFFSGPILSPSTIQLISHVSFSLIGPLFRASTVPYGHQALGTQTFGCVLEVFKSLSFLSGFISQRSALAPVSEQTGHFYILGVGGEDMARGDHAPGVLGASLSTLHERGLSQTFRQPLPSPGHAPSSPTTEHLHSTYKHIGVQCVLHLLPQTWELRTARVLIISVSQKVMLPRIQPVSVAWMDRSML